MFIKHYIPCSINEFCKCLHTSTSERRQPRKNSLYNEKLNDNDLGEVAQYYEQIGWNGDLSRTLYVIGRQISAWKKGPMMMAFKVQQKNNKTMLKVTQRKEVWKHSPLPNNTRRCRAKKCSTLLCRVCIISHSTCW